MREALFPSVCVCGGVKIWDSDNFLKPQLILKHVDATLDSTNKLRVKGAFAVGTHHYSGTTYSAGRQYSGAVIGAACDDSN